MVRPEIAPVFVAALVLLTACGGEQGGTGYGAPSVSPTESPSASVSSDPSASSSLPSAPAARGTRIVLSPSEFGPMLFDAKKQAIYLFDVETSDEPKCYEDCAEAWPPVLTDGAAVAGPGLRPGLLGSTRRRDGSTQVTYGGHPLYYYAHEGPGEVECHDIFLNGGNWYVVQADGNRAP